MLEGVSLNQLLKVPAWGWETLNISCVKGSSVKRTILVNPDSDNSILSIESDPTSVKECNDFQPFFFKVVDFSN